MIMSRFYLGDLTSEEVKVPTKAEMVLIPIGSFEQHGRHLPLATDSIIASEVTRMVAERMRPEFLVLIGPLIPFGKSVEHAKRPGTISIKTRVLEDLLVGICKDLARHGFKKIVFINGHGGNTDLLSMLLREIRAETGSFVFSIYLYSEELLAEPLSRFKELQETDIFHACALETSFMMSLRPDLVHPEYVRKEIPSKFTEKSGYGYLRLGGGRGVQSSWLIDDISSSGVIGDPTKASPAIGRVVLESLVDQICKVLREIKKV